MTSHWNPDLNELFVSLKLKRKRLNKNKAESMHISFIHNTNDALDMPMPSIIPGYISNFEFVFSKDQKDSIIRTTSYYRKDYAFSVISFQPHSHEPMLPSTSAAVSFTRNPKVEVGSLDKLPLELIQEIILHIDMRTAFSFRQANLRARNVVDSLKQYQSIATYGLHLFRAILQTGLATKITLIQFYEALVTRDCALCSNFAGFIFLLTWKRCCFKCLQRAPEFEVQPREVVKKRLKATKDELDQLWSMKILPGIYTMRQWEQRYEAPILSLHHAASVCRRQPTPVRQQQQEIEAEYKPSLTYMASCALPYYDTSTGEVDYGVCCSGCQLAMQKGTLPSGFHNSRWAFEARDKIYSRDGFLQHFRWCEQAQNLWMASKFGTRVPKELPDLARRGGYFNFDRELDSFSG